MNPLIGLAISLVPEFLKLIKNGTLEGGLGTRIEGVFKDVANTTSVDEASKKVGEDPAIKTQLQVRLAEIALDAQRSAIEDAAKARETALRDAALSDANTSDARSNLRALIKEGPLVAWTPSALSYIVVIGFIGTLLLMGLGYVKLDKSADGLLQIFNVLIGALATAFATVMNFWLGSSLGSRRKDSSLAIQNAQNQVAAEDLAKTGGGPDTASGTGAPKPPPPAPDATAATPPDRAPRDQPPQEPAADVPEREEGPIAPAAPSLFREVLPALVKPHRHFPGGSSWALTGGGIAIDGAPAKGTGGQPKTVKRIWDAFGPLCAASARKYNVPVELIVATIATESGGNPNAQRTEAKIHDESAGLMQTLVATARNATGRRSLTAAQLFDPATSIDAGTAYISQQRASTHFDPPLVAAAYNAGSLRPDTAAANRWKLLCYPTGTGQHIDRFVAWFSDCMVVSKADSWSTQSGGTPAFAAALANTAAGLSAGEAETDPPEAGRSSPDWPPRPSFPPLRTDGDKHRIFGDFTFKAAPIQGNPEHVAIEGDWEHRNIIDVSIPIKAFLGKAGPLKMRFHRLAADQLIELWLEWEKQGLLEKIVSFDGSYNPRFIRGSTSVLSNHAFGSAFDINAAFNPLGKVPALLGAHGSVRALVPTANQHGFYWGGHFRSRLDGMHFEVARLV